MTGDLRKTISLGLEMIRMILRMRLHARSVRRLAARRRVRPAGSLTRA